MRAVVCRTLGTPDQLVVENVAPPPAPGPWQVRIAVHAAGINFPDMLVIAGRYQHRQEPPFIPGQEAAGEVLEVGPGVTRWKSGDRVVALLDHGAFAEEAIVEDADLYPLPAGFSFAEGACFHFATSTSAHAVMQRGRLAPRETLLVHGAGGGVGLAAVEIGKLLGARVIAVAGGAEKLAIARARGADHIIDHRDGPFGPRVLELTGGEGADVIFDPVGGDVFDASLRCAAWGGRMLIVGFAGGRIQTIPGNRPLLRSLEIIGVAAITHAKRRPHDGAAYQRWMYGHAGAGGLKPHVFAALPLDGVAEAMGLLSARHAIGRVVLLPRPEAV